MNGQYLSIPGMKAGASFASKQYTPVKLSSTAADTVLQATTTAMWAVGIIQNDPASGESAEVACLGISRAVAGTSTITRGTTLSYNSTGVVNVTAGKVFALALQAAGAVGDLIWVQIIGARPY